MKPRTPRAFTIMPAHSEGKPVVLIDFGKFGRITLDAHDVSRLIAELEKTLHKARDLGET